MTTITPSTFDTISSYGQDSRIDLSEHLACQAESRTQLTNIVDTLGRLTSRRMGFMEDPISHEQRVQQTVLFTSDGHEYGLRITDPHISSMSPDHTVAMFPGITQTPKAGAAQHLHNKVAGQYPDSRIISIATDGVNDDCKPLDWHTAYRKEFSAMAEARLGILKYFAEDEPVTLVAVSMGTVLADLAAADNIDKQLLNIDKIVNQSPAVVTPEHVRRDMLVRFPGHVIKEGWREALRNPKELFDCFAGQAPQRRSTAYALAGNVRNLVRGMLYETIDTVADAYKIGIVVGSRDPLGQLDTWNRLQQDHPNHVQILVNEGRGHASDIHSGQAALDIRTVWERLDATSPMPLTA